jgi:hypothetical protein
MSPELKSFRGGPRYAARGGRWANGAVARELESRTSGHETILAYKIPEAPYSDEAFQWLHKSFEVTDGVLATLEIFGVELTGLGIAGLGLTALGPWLPPSPDLWPLGQGTPKPGLRSPGTA